MRHRVERVVCPCCRKHPVLMQICTACHGKGEAIMLHKPGGHEVEIHDLADEAKLRAQYPDEPTPVHERTTLHQAWLKFRRMIEIQHASIQQNREMKRAFVGGAYWMLEMCSIQMDPDKDPTPDDLEYMQRIHAEIMTFVSDVEAGRI